MGRGQRVIYWSIMPCHLYLLLGRWEDFQSSFLGDNRRFENRQRRIIRKSIWRPRKRKRRPDNNVQMDFLDHERTWTLFAFLSDNKAACMDPSRGWTFIICTLIRCLHFRPGFRNLPTLFNPFGLMDSLQTPFRLAYALSYDCTHRSYAVQAMNKFRVVK